MGRIKVFTKVLGYLKLTDNEFEADDFEDFGADFEERFACHRMVLPESQIKKYSRMVERLLKQKEKTFSELLLWYIDRSGRSDVIIYKRANVDRRLFSKIRKNREYAPKKNTVLAFAIALELSLEDTKALLHSAGYSLSKSKEEDIIVEYFIERQIYDFYVINEYLGKFKRELIGV